MAGVWSLRIPDIETCCSAVHLLAVDSSAMQSTSRSTPSRCSLRLHRSHDLRRTARSRRASQYSVDVRSKNGTTRSSQIAERVTSSERSYTMVCRTGFDRHVPATEAARSVASSARRSMPPCWYTWNTGWTCQPSRHASVAVDRDREAAFAVDEADDPLRSSIDLAFPADCPHRTDCHCSCVAPYEEGVTCERVPPDTRSFQHIARFV